MEKSHYAKSREKKNKPRKEKIVPVWKCPAGPTTDKCGLPASCVNCYHFGKHSCRNPVRAEEEGSYSIQCFSCKYLKPEFISVKCGR